MRRTIIFSCPETEHLIDGLLVEGRLENAKKGVIVWKNFEDNYPNLFIKDASEICGADCVFLTSLSDPHKLFSQLSIIYAIPRYLARSLTLICPYFPTGTMERVDEEGQIATAKTLTRILSTIPFSSTGPAKIVIYDIHALQERFYFDDSVLPVIVSAIPLFIERLRRYQQENPDLPETVIAFPDEGAHKRFNKLFGGFETLICSKVRDGDARIVTIKEGDANGKHVVIVDDLVRSGGTLIECQGALLKAGAKLVSAYTTHGLFPEETWRRFSEPKEGQVPFHRFFITDSCPETASVIQDKQPFEVIPLAPIIAQHVRRILGY